LGQPSIRAAVQVFNSNGEHLLDREGSGKIQFFGENTQATYDFSKQLGKAICADFD
jgi:hypothetical protein